MSALDEINAAALKRDIAVGLEQLDKGHYKTYDESNVMQLAKEVGQLGRGRYCPPSRKNAS